MALRACHLIFASFQPSGRKHARAGIQDFEGPLDSRVRVSGDMRCLRKPGFARRLLSEATDLRKFGKSDHPTTRIDPADWQ